MLPVSWPTSLSAFVPEIPVLARLLEVAVPSSPRSTTCAALACPLAVLAVVCACPAVGHDDKPKPAKNRAPAIVAGRWWFLRCIRFSSSLAFLVRLPRDLRRRVLRPEAWPTVQIGQRNNEARRVTARINPATVDQVDLK